jgi:hypothetical protein
VTIDLAAIRFRLLQGYRADTLNDSEARDVCCQDIAALCAEVERLQRMYEADVRTVQAERETEG